MHVGVVRGVTKLGKKSPSVCGSYQLGEQIKLSHNMLQHITKNILLELIHMNSMVPMQVENIASKRYVFVCVG